MKNRLKVLLIILFFSIFIPHYVFAQNCSQEQVNKFNALVNNIKFDFILETDNKFKLNIYNIPKEIMVVNSQSSMIFYNNSDNVSTDSGYIGGKIYEFIFSPTSEITCELGINFSKNLYVPKYNKYSEKDICKSEDYKDFKYCNKNYQGNITDFEFEKELNKYKEKLKNVEQIDESNESNSNLPYLNIIIISVISLIIFISLLSITLIKARKSRRKF